MTRTREIEKQFERDYRIEEAEVKVSEVWREKWLLVAKITGCGVAWQTRTLDAQMHLTPDYMTQSSTRFANSDVSQDDNAARFGPFKHGIPSGASHTSFSLVLLPKKKSSYHKLSGSGHTDSRTTRQKAGE